MVEKTSIKPRKLHRKRYVFLQCVKSKLLKLRNLSNNANADITQSRDNIVRSKNAIDSLNQDFKINSRIVDKHFIGEFYDLNHSKQLGAGNYGEVILGIDKQSDVKVAVKCIPKKKSSRIAVMEEATILKNIEHDNVVRFKSLHEDRECWYLVMELVRGEELYERIVQKGLFSYCETAAIIKQLVTALLHLHSNGIVHGDIKPENCIVTENSNGFPSIKISDFGSSFCINSRKEKQRDYTAAYSSPEVILGKANARSAGDIWSLGVMIYILLTGVHPFDPKSSLSDEEIVKSIVHSTPDYSLLMNNSARKLVSKCLSKNPNERPSAEEMLRNEWVQSAF